MVIVLIQFYQPARNIDNGQVLPIHFEKTYTIIREQTLHLFCEPLATIAIIITQTIIGMTNSTSKNNSGKSY
ncbi:hypothetical protein J2Y60_003685 [Arcicella sp. BE140]|nr:hypothetical protein [Arcicella sp. BE51]MDR6813473.1 hypothetical protein [Arcicella sp. BE140]MDR6824786.1 hypothetical protein [Arcicella sp. BE139]